VCLWIGFDNCSVNEDSVGECADLFKRGDDPVERQLVIAPNSSDSGADG